MIISTLAARKGGRKDIKGVLVIKVEIDFFTQTQDTFFSFLALKLFPLSVAEFKNFKNSSKIVQE